MQLNDLIARIRVGRNLSFDESRAAIDAMLDGTCSELEMGEFLLALRAKGETVDEIAGAASALRAHMTPIRTSRPGLVDTCGTGGDGSRTFNISTAAALVAAAAGVPVAKHGNRKITSATGSADVLAALGVNIDADVTVVERCLDALGIGFCFAPRLHPAMKRVAPVRSKLGVPTIFNLLGPLSNPAGAPYQLLGTGRRAVHDRLARALRRLGTLRSAVVSGQDGLDEVTLATNTEVTLVADPVREFWWHPRDFGLTSAPIGSLTAETPSESAAIIRRVLANEPGPARDIVVLNAAAAIWVAGAESTTTAAAERAAEAIASRRALQLLERLADLSRQ
ncbi:MAG: anthranilate phosphoribosyltransferase [Planctomycetes bacterium]|nr:anthranilate phosphoribosyltransferase [Planctomycetota bacterium]